MNACIIFCIEKSLRSERMNKGNFPWKNSISPRWNSARRREPFRYFVYPVRWPNFTGDASSRPRSNRLKQAFPQLICEETSPRFRTYRLSISFSFEVHRTVPSTIWSTSSGRCFSVPEIPTDGNLISIPFALSDPSRISPQSHEKIPSGK